MTNASSLSGVGQACVPVGGKIAPYISDESRQPHEGPQLPQAQSHVSVHRGSCLPRNVTILDPQCINLLNVRAGRRLTRACYILI